MWSPCGTSQWVLANIYFGGSIYYLFSFSFLSLRVIGSLCLLISPGLNSGSCARVIYWVRCFSGRVPGPSIRSLGFARGMRCCTFHELHCLMPISSQSACVAWVDALSILS